MKDNICLFLGAGASKAFGYPTTVEFVDNLQDLPHKDFFDQILSFVQNNLQQTPDIEKIIWQMDDLISGIQDWRNSSYFKNQYFLKSCNYRLIQEGGSQTTSLSHDFDHYVNIIEDIYSKIKVKVYETYWRKPEGETEDYKELYRKLFEFLETDSINIFTTNYDTTLDNLFLENPSEHHLYSDGFVADYQSIRFEDNFKDEHKYKVYKLHGSVNWRRNPEDGNKITRIDHPAFTVLNEHPILFPGTKYSSEYPFRVLYNHLKVTLEKSSIVIFIGFSFRDDELNRIFKNALKENNKLVFIIWNPEKVITGLDENRIKDFQSLFSMDSIDHFFDFFNNLEEPNNSIK